MNEHYVLTPEKIEKIKAEKPKIENQEEISEFFKDLLFDKMSSSSLAISCEFCNRFYFICRGDYDEGELEYYQKCAELNPEMYCEDSDYIAWCYVNGKQYVYDCPCNGPRRVETFMWSHRKLFVKYLRKRVAEMQRQVSEEQYLINSIPKAGEQIDEYKVI